MDDEKDKTAKEPISDRKLALLYGLRTGSFLALAVIILFQILPLLLPIGNYSLLLVLLVLSAGTYWVGLRMGRRTGRTGMGTLAGMWTSLLCFSIYTVYSVVLLLLFQRGILDTQISEVARQENLAPEAVRQTYFVGLASWTFTYIAITTALGSLFGLLGGWMGKREYAPLEDDESEQHEK